MTIDLQPRLSVTVDMLSNTVIDVGDPRTRGTNERRCMVRVGVLGLNALVLTGAPDTMRRLAEAALTAAIDVENRLTEGKAS